MATLGSSFLMKFVSMVDDETNSSLGTERVLELLDTSVMETEYVSPLVTKFNGDGVLDRDIFIFTISFILICGSEAT